MTPDLSPAAAEFNELLPRLTADPDGHPDILEIAAAVATTSRALFHPDDDSTPDYFRASIFGEPVLRPSHAVARASSQLPMEIHQPVLFRVALAEYAPIPAAVGREAWKAAFVVPSLHAQDGPWRPLGFGRHLADFGVARLLAVTLGGLVWSDDVGESVSVVVDLPHVQGERVFAFVPSGWCRKLPSDNDLHSMSRMNTNIPQPPTTDDDGAVGGGF
ncbi:MAG: hypothetical protein JWR63_1263 [Conexibacter sp.]|nr:hypothetical protein [Conexibacter sp.]